MYGWLVTNCLSEIEKINGLSENTMFRKINDFYFVMKQNGRFSEDKLFYETKDYFILIDGIVLNKNELLDKYKKSYVEIILQIYQEDRDELPRSLRGPFSGLIYDKNSDSIFAFTNHTGDGGVFYYAKDSLIISNNFDWIIQSLKILNISYSLDTNAINYICTFGFMLDNTTYVDIIKRCMPGQAIYYVKGKATKNYYHIFNNYDVINLTEEEIIDRIDNLFRKAIKREFDKDREYGYKSIVDLSGGLDCRVVNYVAKSMGYSDILNVSFSQTFSDEYKAMIALSRDLKFKLFHYPLDNATHLYDIDKIVKKNYGLSFYAGAGAIMSIMENINLDIYGLEHGGIMGEMADGVFPGPGYDHHIPPSFEKGMPFSRKFDLSILPSKILEEYDNLELFTIMGRGLLGGANTQLIRRDYTGYVSPFEDVDFYDFFISIPVETRGKGQILKKWISLKYPEAFNIIEDKLMCRPNSSKIIKKYKKYKKKFKGKLNQYFGRLIPALGINNMNPTEYWYNTNENIKTFVDDYYKSNISRMDKYINEQKMVRELFESNNINDKLISLTILSTIKQFF
ncbi:MAG: hypothetical protein KH297_03150 [Firmicutes bacterium]|nr:hypothetical protein [Bacillota bacterium]